MATRAASTSLPRGLEPVHVRRAVDFIEDHVAELVELYFEQANFFSAVVGIFGTRALDSVSPYKRHKHPDIAQQRFPDLSLNGRLNPTPDQALESKASLGGAIALRSPGLVYRVALPGRSDKIHKGESCGGDMAGGCCLSREVRLEIRGQHGGLGRWRANTYFRAEATGGEATRKAGVRSVRCQIKAWKARARW